MTTRDTRWPDTPMRAAPCSRPVAGRRPAAVRGLRRRRRRAPKRGPTARGTRVAHLREQRHGLLRIHHRADAVLSLQEAAARVARARNPRRWLWPRGLAGPPLALASSRCRRRGLDGRTSCCPAPALGGTHGAPRRARRPAQRSLRAADRGRAAAPCPGTRGPRDRLLRPSHGLPRDDRPARADQPDDHLVSVVPLASARVGLRPVLALDGRVRLARVEGALLRP